MESVVNRIIEIDRMADDKISDARKQSDDILKNAEEKSRALFNEINSAADKRISEVEQINKSDYDLKISSLAEKYQNEEKNMDSFFENSHIEIENKIFSEIVGE